MPDRLLKRIFVNDIVKTASQSDNIIFTGFVDGDTMQELYSNAALYALASHTESFALTLPEAISCGARCLVSDIPESTTVLKDFSCTFRVGDTNSLAEAIDTPLALPDDTDKAKQQIRLHCRKLLL